MASGADRVPQGEAAVVLGEERGRLVQARGGCAGGQPPEGSPGNVQDGAPPDPPPCVGESLSLGDTAANPFKELKDTLVELLTPSDLNQCTGLAAGGTWHT